MKADELSNEQLIDDLIDSHILGHPLFRSTSVLRKELLVRLKSGDKAKNAMDKIFNAMTENNGGETFCEVRKIRQDKIRDISNKYRRCIVHR